MKLQALKHLAWNDFEWGSRCEQCQSALSRGHGQSPWNGSVFQVTGLKSLPEQKRLEQDVVRMLFYCHLHSIVPAKLCWGGRGVVKKYYTNHILYLSLTLMPVVMDFFCLVWISGKSLMALSASLQRQSKCWFIVSPHLADHHASIATALVGCVCKIPQLESRGQGITKRF